MNPKDSSKDSLIDCLRAKTRVLHATLEEHRLLNALVSASLTEEVYAKALRHLYRPQAALEQAIMAFLTQQETGLVFEPRHIYLQQDLEAIAPGLMAECHGSGQRAALVSDAAIKAAPIKSVPIRTVPINSLAEAAGYLYVLEGSKLGGEYIYRCLQSSLPAYSHHFFASADSGMQYLNRLMQSLEEQIPQSEWINSERCAQQAFEYFITG